MRTWNLSTARLAAASRARLRNVRAGTVRTLWPPQRRRCRRAWIIHDENSNDRAWNMIREVKYDEPAFIRHWNTNLRAMTRLSLQRGAPPVDVHPKGVGSALLADLT